ncbi:MAG: hypothetical protein J6Y54_08295, partial [Lentisphaeria bacterium]|nr:hypothetical protein [Lentisphaeria bacterium]
RLETPRNRRLDRRLRTRRAPSDRRQLRRRTPRARGRTRDACLVRKGRRSAAAPRRQRRILAVAVVADDRRSPRRERRTVSLEEAFRTAYVVSNHLPNRDDNQKVIGEELFSSMRPHATFINTGRGGAARRRRSAWRTITRRRTDCIRRGTPLWR